MVSPPLAGLAVVICRPLSQAASVVAGLEAAGGRAVGLPLLEVCQPADEGAALRRSLDRLDQFDWMVFTSANAVRAVVDVVDGPWSAGPAIAAVGPKTADLLIESGYSVRYTSKRGTAADLARTLPARPGDRVLAPLGDRAGATLETGLKDRGVHVERVEAYRTIWADVDPSVLRTAREADAVLLTSASIAERFGSLFTAGSPPVVCIGPTTEQAARSAGLVVIGTAREPTPAALIEVLVRTLGDNVS